MPGYCMTGRLIMASAPVSIMMMAITHANTGRSIKKRDSMATPSALGDVGPGSAFRYRGRLGFRHRSLDRAHFRADAGFLQPVHDHAISGGNTASDEPFVVD